MKTDMAFFLIYFKDVLSNVVNKVLKPLRITDRIDENSVMEMETVCSFYVWNYKQGNNLNKLLTRKSLCKVFGEILHHKRRS